MWQGTECPPVDDEDDEDQGGDDDYGNKLGQNIIRNMPPSHDDEDDLDADGHVADHDTDGHPVGAELVKSGLDGGEEGGGVEVVQEDLQCDLQLVPEHNLFGLMMIMKIMMAITSLRRINILF